MLLVPVLPNQMKRIPTASRMSPVLIPRCEALSPGEMKPVKTNTLEIRRRRMTPSENIVLFSEADGSYGRRQRRNE